MPHALVNNRAAMNALRGPVRLRTLTALRWLAVGGQTLAIFAVHFGLGFPTPLGLCLGAIAASAWLNLFTILRFSPQRILSDREAAAYIAFDIAQLCTLLFFTGGLANPFSALIIAPVTIAASFLTLRFTLIIAALGVAGVTVLGLYHMPLPWTPGDALEIAPIYKAGVWAALTFSVCFFAAYAHRIAAESAQMRSALAATQLVLGREQKMSALGGLAAAAAHELGTPLATIQLTAKEMLRDLKDHEDLAEDAELLISQAKRCRDILGRLSKHGDAGDVMYDRIGVASILKEAADPFFESDDGVEIRIEADSLDGAVEPELQRRPEIIYGVRNFIENAVAHAKSTVVVAAKWDADTISISVNDDGPGFSAEILARLGEPYVSGRTGARRDGGGAKKGGLGLGFFIAKTLLDGAGAKVSFENHQWGENAAETGAIVTATFPAGTISAAS
ncbi:MAG: ActS/PrrB/RegB family redox-sensitive histidine kinase [Marinicaulis sp.]|nr:ActS/PrrB/RegB family redox-sensitive histidine kinase [Marinicaulis sp.]NNE40951.1 ActS/PrrB/RegB family redox-sensitive histidine kinase [Marinicaulis sp.]NNL88659.1 ActS/PrrB/RegB family redox-sensitive histidine kinase [Marinicaulis sp.]